MIRFLPDEYYSSTYKIDFKKYFITFGDIVLYIDLDGRCCGKIKRVGSLFIVFPIIGIVDVAFASHE